MNPKTIGPDEIEEILAGGQFRPDEKLRRKVKATIAAPQQRRYFPWPATWSFSRRALATGLSVLLAVALFTGVVVALSTQEKAANVLDGVSAVYQNHLVHPVGESKQAGDISVTLDWVYADWNQVLVAYTAQGPAGDGQAVQRVTVSATSAVLADGTSLQHGLGGGYSEITTESTVSGFLLPKDARERESIHLRLNLNAAHVQYPTDDPTLGGDQPEGKAVTGQFTQSGGGDVAFDMDIPITPGKTFPVGQTVEAAGTSITLNDITIAPSMSIVSLCFQAPDSGQVRDWTVGVRLAAGGKEYFGVSGGTKNSVQTDCRQVQFLDSVPQDLASYTLRVDELIGSKFGPGDSPSPEEHPEELTRIKGPWVFEIK